jgi:hypothetical protein
MNLTFRVLSATLFILIVTAFVSAGIALANDGGPVVYRYIDPDTGQIVNYVGIPGGPVTYSEMGPGGIKSVTSVSPGNPVVYSNLGPGAITSVSYAGPGGPVVYSRLGQGGITSLTSVNPGGPVVVSASSP